MMGLPSSLLLEDSLSSYIFHAAPPSSSWQWWIEVFIVLNWFLVYPEFLCFIASIFSHLLPYIHCIKGWFYNYILTQVWNLPIFQISPSLFTAPFQRKCYGFKELTRSVPCTWISLSSHSLGCNGRSNVSWKIPSNSVNHNHICDTINQICLTDVTLLTTCMIFC